jgi:multisubunit Na+/H+ antiporter MnhC subunit
VNPLGPYAPRLTWLTAAFVTAFCALLATIGADAHWLAALGRRIVELGAIPQGVPYAAAPSAGWDNVPVLGELAFHGLESTMGDRGLLLAQGLAVGLALALVALDIRRAGAADAPSALVLLLVATGSASTLLVVRAQLFSLALFPVVVVLLRAQARAPSDAIWLLVPLFALWANLHGGVLVGVVLAGVYLIVDRLRHQPLLTLSVLCASIAACFATPALLSSGHYYRGVLFSEAASKGEGLWAPLSASSPFDLAFVLVAAIVVGLALVSRPQLWELLALAGLAAAAAHVGRNGVWLLLFAAAPAAAGLTGSRPWQLRLPRGLTAIMAAALLALIVAGLSRTPWLPAADTPLRLAAARAAGGLPILADDINAEALALDGRRVWIANPLDAFDLREQRLYLDWTAGRPAGDALLARTRAVLVTRDTPAQRRLARNPGFRRLAGDDLAALYVRYRPARWQSPPSTAFSSTGS